MGRIIATKPLLYLIRRELCNAKLFLLWEKNGLWRKKSNPPPQIGNRSGRCSENTKESKKFRNISYAFAKTDGAFHFSLVRLKARLSHLPGETEGMSFLDNLENNLKALESLEQGGLDQSKRREAERDRAIASAPWAEQLKTGPYAQALIQQSIRAGHTRRMKVHLAWLGTTLRLEARGQRLELRPTPNGVESVLLEGDGELYRATVDLKSSPEGLVGQWMAKLDARKAAEELDDVRASQFSQQF